MTGHRLQSSQQGYQEVHLAHAQGRRHIFQTKWSYVFYHFGSLSRIPLYSPGEVIHTKDCL